MFAEAINTPAHLERFTALAAKAATTVDDAVTEIEENIRWMTVKAPEIRVWVENEKGSGMKLNASTLTAALFIFVMALK